MNTALWQSPLISIPPIELVLLSMLIVLLPSMLIVLLVPMSILARFQQISIGNVMVTVKRQCGPVTGTSCILKRAPRIAPFFFRHVWLNTSHLACDVEAEKGVQVQVRMDLWNEYQIEAGLLKPSLPDCPLRSCTCTLTSPVIDPTRRVVSPPIRST